MMRVGHLPSDLLKFSRQFLTKLSIQSAMNPNYSESARHQPPGPWQVEMLLLETAVSFSGPWLECFGDYAQIAAI